MLNKITTYYNSKQGILPIFISDFLDICDPVLSFDKFMEGINLNKYLKKIPEHDTGRIRYNPVNMLKTVLFGFMSQGYISLRELEDNCKVNIRFMYLMDNKKPSYRTFGYFINEILEESIEDIFNDINKAIFELENVDLNHIYIDGSKFEANANKYSWVWKKSTEKSRYRLYEKITTLFNEVNADLASFGLHIETNTEYIPEQLHEISNKYATIWQLNPETFVYGKGHRKTVQQRQYEKLLEYTSKLEEYIEKINPKAIVNVYGQELLDESFAICQADMLMKGQNPDNIRLGNTLTEDRFRGEHMRFLISNPPFGVTWKDEEKKVKEEADLGRYLDEEVELYYVLLFAGMIVGCGGINFADNMTTGKISWDIVHPAYQGKSLGTKLLNHRIEKLRNISSIKKIIVRTSQLVYKFYEKQGFVLLEVKKDYWADGLDMYKMEYKGIL